MKQMSQSSPPRARGIVHGDVLYVQHPKHGVLSGRVASVGRDGVNIEHHLGENGMMGVRWDSILGHKERRVRQLRLLERGEDGGIAEDEEGKRVFVAGEIPPEDPPDEELLNKAADDGVPLHRSAMLLDVGALSDCCTNRALEVMHKGLADEDGLAHDIWVEHENPFIRAMVERFSDRGLLRIATVRQDLERWLSGEYFAPAREPLLPPQVGMMARWNQAELDLVRTYLASVPPDEMSLSDWELAIEYMVQRYMPMDQMAEEAEWLATKSYLMGKAQAALLGDVAANVATALSEAMPGTVSEAVAMFNLSHAVETVLEYGRARAVENVVELTESVRHRLKSVVLEHQAQRLAGDPSATVERLQQKLLEQFNTLNRDWRRIAITEAGEMANQGTIMALPAGSYVKRIEMYRGACAHCKRIDGRIFRVTTAADPDKDGEKDVWPGKTNVGRSAAPRKRVGNELVDRTASERWWAAAGLQHPHCRGRWEPMPESKPGDDPVFADWLKRRVGLVEGLPSPV